MTKSVKAVANSFLALASQDGRAVTNMQLQKLVYIAHGVSLGYTGRPLYYEDTRAWQFGPVVPELYSALQKYGRGPVTSTIETDDEVDLGGDEGVVIRSVWKTHGKFTAAQLVSRTHQPNTPWSETWETTPFGVIPQESVKEHYQALLSRNK